MNSFKHVKSCLFLVGYFNLLGKKINCLFFPVIFVVYYLYKFINILAEFCGKGVRNRNVSLSHEMETAMFREMPIVSAQQSASNRKGIS